VVCSCLGGFTKTADSEPEVTVITLTVAESTSLATIAYDASRELLQIEFPDRTVYRYRPCRPMCMQPYCAPRPKEAISIASSLGSSCSLEFGLIVKSLLLALMRSGALAGDKLHPVLHLGLVDGNQNPPAAEIVNLLLHLTECL